MPFLLAYFVGVPRLVLKSICACKRLQLQMAMSEERKEVCMIAYRRSKSHY